MSLLFDVNLFFSKNIEDAKNLTKNNSWILLPLFADHIVLMMVNLIAVIMTICTTICILTGNGVIWRRVYADDDMNNIQDDIIYAFRGEFLFKKMKVCYQEFLL